MAVLEQIADRLVLEAMRQGEFENLAGRGEPIDLSAYFEAPVELRSADALLRQAGMLLAEAELLRELHALKELGPGPLADADRLNVQRSMHRLRLKVAILHEQRTRPYR